MSARLYIEIEKDLDGVRWLWVLIGADWHSDSELHNPQILQMGRAFTRGGAERKAMRALRSTRERHLRREKNPRYRIFLEGEGSK